MVEVVLERNGLPIFPFGIPCKRSNRDVSYRISLSALLIAVGCCVTNLEKWLYIYGTISYCIIFYTIKEIISRSLSLIEEYNHLTSRYNGNLWELLKGVYEFNKFCFVLIIIATCSLPIVGNLFTVVTAQAMLPWIFPLLATHLLLDQLKLDECTMNEAKQLDRSKGMDYGSGMANSYFYGYLNVILPRTGDERKGLVEHIENFESAQGVEFPIKKLFILIPKSGFGPTRITEQSVIADYSNSLESKIVDRAGTRQRVYHNSVYKLHRNEGQLPTYVCAEYASALLTLFEVMQNSQHNSGTYRKYYSELVTNFYMTLRQLIKESRTCRDLCELIYYKDIYDNGEAVENLDVGRLILDRIDGVV